MRALMPGAATACHPTSDLIVVWAKFAAMAEGARIASRQFWK
jgi:hypothetical protein